MTQSRRSPRNWRTVGLRRGVQIVFLLLFFVLLILAGGVLREGQSSWLKLFFLFDPLLLLCTLLAAGAVPKLLLLSLATVALTVVLGRVFCGWACPLGTIHDLTGRLLDRLQRRVRHDHWSPWQKSKYYLLVGFLVMAALGGHWIAIWDPLVLLYRTSTVVLWPAAQLSVEQTAAAVRDAAAVEQPLRPKWAEQDEAGQAQQQSSATLKNRLARPVAAVTNPVHGFLKDHVFVVQRQSFLGAGLIAAVFAGLLALNAVRRRFWCRYLCPLGALLGLLAWRPLLRRATQEQSCNQCDLCGQACHGAASAAAGSGWKPSECLGCLNCTASCNRQAMRFTFIWPWQRQPQVETVDLRRRALLGSAVGGIAALAVIRANPQARQAIFNPQLIRPPGALPEPEFLQRCTACGLCMKVCPTGGLQPAISEAGLEGIWTPRLVPQIGYCQYSCNLCGQVCPTGAIQPLSVEQKQQVRIGLAFFDTTRCIPYAYGRDCTVCWEVCPLPEKAIFTEKVTVVDRNGNTIEVMRPRIDIEKCIGCGNCEHDCVFRDLPAIRVHSANETRHRKNQPELAPPASSDPYG